MFGIVINKDNIKVDFVVLNDDKTPQNHDLKEDESIIETDWQNAISMVNPKWNGTEWIETATQEDINERKNLLLPWMQ